MKGKSLNTVFFYIVGVVFLAGFFTFATVTISHKIPEENRELFRDVMSTLRDGVIIILTYYYGSSKSSADKNEILDKKLNGTDENPTPNNPGTSP